MTRLDLIDAFEEQSDKRLGRDAVGADRYTRYNHKSRAESIGQRIDLVLTNMPMGKTVKGEAEI